MHLTEYQTPETWRAVTVLVAAPCGGLFNYKVLETCSVSCCSFQMKKKKTLHVSDYAVAGTFAPATE